MSDSDEKIVKPCLILPEIPDNFDPNSVPQTGEEYLMHMAYERNRLPAVSCIQVPKRKELNKIQTPVTEERVSSSCQYASYISKLTTLLPET